MTQIMTKPSCFFAIFGFKGPWDPSTPEAIIYHQQIYRSCTELSHVTASSKKTFALLSIPKSSGDNP